MSLKWYFETDSLKLFFPRNAQLHTVPYVLQIITIVGPYWLVQILLTNRIDWTPRSLFFTQRKFYLKIRMVLWPILFTWPWHCTFRVNWNDWLQADFLRIMFILKTLLGKFYRANKKDMGQCMHHYLSLKWLPKVHIEQ